MKNTNKETMIEYSIRKMIESYSKEEKIKNKEMN